MIPQKINGEYLRSLIDEYTPDPNTLTDEKLEMYTRIDNLEPAEKIILLLYSEMASERKLADALHTSRTTVRRILDEIRQKITGTKIEQQ